jgi:hypothetical protein
MSKPIWRARRVAWRRALPLTQLLFLIAAPGAFAERLTVNPETNLSLDFSLKDTTACIMVPETLYDPTACVGVPRRETADPKSEGQGVRALVVLRQAEPVFILTVASLARPGIGQMSEEHIQGFIEGTLKRLTEESGAPTHSVEETQPPYTVQQVGGVPVVRWEYTTELPEDDPRANTASAVVYLVPSRDTLDIVSLNTHRKDLVAARSLGEQVISTLKVPLTIDAEEFGTRLAFGRGAMLGIALISSAIVIMGAIWLWARYRRGSRVED